MSPHFSLPPPPKKKKRKLTRKPKKSHKEGALIFPRVDNCGLSLFKPWFSWVEPHRSLTSFWSLEKASSVKTRQKEKKVVFQLWYQMQLYRCFLLRQNKPYLGIQMFYVLFVHSSGTNKPSLLYSYLCSISLFVRGSLVWQTLKTLLYRSILVASSFNSSKLTTVN